jgi:hypothetical protein
VANILDQMAAFMQDDLLMLTIPHIMLTRMVDLDSAQHMQTIITVMEILELETILLLRSV